MFKSLRDGVSRVLFVDAPRRRPLAGEHAAGRAIEHGRRFLHRDELFLQRCRRIAMLALVPGIVMAVATALGIAVYRVSSSATPDSSRPRVEPLIATDSNAATMSDSSMGYAPNPALDSTPAQRDSAADSSTRRVEAPQVVPGWLPRGRAPVTPAD